MASGPGGTDGWNELIANLNGIFSDQTKRKDFAKDFKIKHGKKGDGKEPGTKPYKFGRYVDNTTLLSTPNKKAQFAIDAGTRHWDSSLQLLEYAIKRSLVREAAGNDDPKEINFVPDYLSGVGQTKAKAVIKDANGNILDAVQAIDAAVSGAGVLTIVIICPPANPRPPA
jgi:hypothetical protein